MIMLRDKRNLQAEKWAAVVEGAWLCMQRKSWSDDNVVLAICFLLIV